MASLNHNFVVSEIDIFLLGALDSSGKTRGGVFGVLPVGSDGTAALSASGEGNLRCLRPDLLDRTITEQNAEAFARIKA
jgi:hypothetical protein